MPRRFSEEYIDRLLNGDEYGNFVELACAIHGSPKLNVDEVDLGLPAHLFVFLAGLEWLAQCVRSGAVTHFESVPLDRQQAIHAAIVQSGNIEMAKAYECGMRKWDDATVDEWVYKNDSAVHNWFRTLLKEYRSDLLAFTA